MPVKARVVAGGLAAVLWAAATAAHAGQPLPSWSEYHGSLARRTAWLAWSRADLRAAEAAASRAARLEPNSGTSLLLLTGVLVEQEDWARAERAARRLQQTDALSPEALLLLGRVSLELGRWEDARGYYQDALQRSPRDARGELGLAMLAARHQQDWTLMQTHLGKALLAEPTFRAASLPLLPGWRVLAHNEDFLSALETLLQP